MKTVWMQCKAEVLRILRNPYYVFWSLMMPILFYILFTKVINIQVPDRALWQAHYLMSMTVYSVMGSAIMTLGIRQVQERNQGWSRFMHITPLSTSVYFFAKMFGQTLIHVFSIIVIFITGAIINDVRLPLDEWILSGLWIIIGSLPFLALGTLVGTMKRIDTATGISNVLFMILAISGGMWMPFNVLPKIVQDIGKWLPGYNFGNGAWEIVRGNSPEWMNVFVLAGYLFLFMLLSSYVRSRQEKAV
ncbi:ABC transporter permease [Bacillus sp. 03113]|uniref:ABC transporter permease n=1 Tax=Bacillus sp. 03113 TaxID=2578211 RepID=UPI00114281B6|nr:ABC transporter permease [Bacillus sp. 03113]